MPPVLERRRGESEDGLRLLRRAAAERLRPIIASEPLAIYVTGSFGRLEAAFPRRSDLDVFFLYDPPDGDRERMPPRLMFTELAAELIRIARELEFEAFSGDGEYLESHNVQYIGQQLGSRHEDAENGFTARLLLLLESQPVLDDELYARLLLDVVGFYFEDFPANPDSFRPTFLINDVLRFWRTLCLNYEHKRGARRRDAETPEEHRAWRAASALDNYKLRFSRLSTCYSMVVALASEPTPVSPERVVQLCRTPPTERWEIAVRRAPEHRRGEADALRARMADAYDRFLDETEDKGSVVARLSDPEDRARLRRDAATFGEAVADLLLATCQPEQRRTILV